MKAIVLKTVLLVFLACLGAETVHAQGRLIRKIQEKTEDRIIDEIFKDQKKPDENVGRETPGTPAGRDYDDATGTRNRRGGGLSQDVPDVPQNISDAEKAFSAQKYAEAKAAIRQALWGVELGIGQNILKSLPESVDGLQAQKERDRVSSTGIGFVGLVIERSYQGKDDVELQTSIGNDAAMLGLAGMYLASGAYVQSTDETNAKQIRFQEHQAFIQYDEYTGYTLSASFGQSSILVLTGVNFDSENQFMAAANNFDIEKIKKELGEQ